MTKRCKDCGIVCDVDHGFRKAHALHARGASGYHAVCIGCEQNKRDASKQTTAGRMAVKVRNVINTHARRLRIAGDRLRTHFGWHPDQMLRDVQMAYAGACVYCHSAFIGMPHGLHDLTLDIVNPTVQPYYATNVRWCCQTCNRAKQQMSPEAWGGRCAFWDAYRRHTKRPVQPSFWD